MKTILLTLFSIIFFMIPDFSLAQLITVTGHVKSSISGKAMQNVNVFESNSGIGTITNKDGYYKLTLNDGALNLKISEIGFLAVSKKMELSSDTTLTIILQPESHRKNRVKDQAESEVEAQKDTKAQEHRSGFKLF